MVSRDCPCRGNVIEQPWEGDKKLWRSKILDNMQEPTDWDTIVAGASRALASSLVQKRGIEANKVLCKTNVSIKTAGGGVL
jgi:hypothetical protein